MLHAELGRRPIDTTIKTRVIGFWMNIIKGKESELTKLMYNILFHQYCNGIYQHRLIHSVKEVLISVGCFDLFNTGIIENAKSVKRQVSETLVDLHTQDWHNKVNLSSTEKNYYLFKQDITLENYLIRLNKKQVSAILRYRLSDHRLQVETGRWENTPLGESVIFVQNKTLEMNSIIFLHVIFSRLKENKFLSHTFIKDLISLNLKNCSLLIMLKN